MPRKKLNEIEQALFIIDMNNGFCEEGALADKSIKHIVPQITQITKDILQNGEGLFIVNDSHTSKSTELKRFPAHCLNSSAEARTIKELAIYEEYANQKFYKNSTCALFAPGLMDTLLSMISLKEIIIVGCCTDICIQNFAVALKCFLDEHNLDIKITIPKDAVETYHIKDVHERREYNALGFKVMENNGINLVRSLKKEGPYYE